MEFYGTGLSSLTLPDRATIANMAPEYGATMGFFPVDAETLAYLRFTGRSAERVALVEAYTKLQGLFRTDADARSDVHRHAGAGSGQGRADAGRAEAPAGPRAAAAVEGGVRQGHGRHAAEARRGEKQRRPVRAVERLGGDRGDHQLHEHVEPVADAGRGPGGEESGRARAAVQALGEDQPRAGIESGDRLSERRGADAVSRTS